MSAGPHTTKEAALRLLLGEMGPLLDQAESSANLLKEGHEILEKDMFDLGLLVSRVENTLLATLEETKRLRNDDLNKKPTIPVTSPKFPLLPVIACGIFSAALAVSGVVIFNLNMIEQARVGRAVNSALQYLDPATKQKLESAIAKASS